MRRLRGHAVLFVVAALLALQTWTRETVSDEERERVVVWNRDTTDFAFVHYRSPDSQIEIQRRTDESGAFLWGLAVGGGAGDGSADAPDTLRFPVGAPGHTLVGRVSALRAIRDLGVLSPDEQARFGITGSQESIRVGFREGAGDPVVRDLLLGDSVFGGSDRYVLNPVSGAGYVLPNDVVRPLAVGEGALRERWLHHYPDGDATQVRVTGAGRERVMERTESGEWVVPGEVGTEVDGGEADAGASPAGGSADVAFANFMERVGQLAIGGYRRTPVPEELRLLLRVDYLDDDGDALGFVELWRDDSAERDPYYVRSERTRIIAEAITALAERVEEGLAGAF